MNVTNLIDLGFTLLIIFMITTSASNQEQTIPVTLPTASKSVQPKVDKSIHFVAVSIDSKGNFYLEENRTPLSLSEFRSRLNVYSTESKPPVMRIRADAAVPWQKMVQLMDELKKANLLKLTFDNQAK
jgi:biopolymer transport protein ExbD